jgi:hypothetical protein
MSEIEEPRLRELITQVAEINNISEFLKDPQLDQALAKIVSLLSNPAVPAETAAFEVVNLTNLSVVFKLKAKNYWLIESDVPDARKKKDLYLTLSDCTEKLAGALKYIVRS